MDTQQTLRATFPTVAEPPYPLLSYGVPFYDACAKYIRNINSQRPYIIASKTLSEKTEFLGQLQKALGPSLVGTWIGIPNHTPITSLLPIIEDMRVKQADALITLGGGSISDGAKLISFALANNVSTAEELAKLPSVTANPSEELARSVQAPKVPVICVPISLSGGEYSRYAGVTDPRTHFKDQYTHERLYPSLVVLDPVLTTSTPISLWLSSGVRSIDHCVEGFLSANATEEGDAACSVALLLLVNGLLKTKKNPKDLEARLECQLGSNLSMTLLHLQVMMGASHGIGHQLGPLGVVHGDTSCINLPAVCKFNYGVNGPKQEVLKKLLCNEAVVQQVLNDASIEEASADLGDIIRAIFNALERPSSLQQVGIGADKLDALARGCLDEVYVKTNPRPIKTEADVMEILQAVLV